MLSLIRPNEDNGRLFSNWKLFDFLNYFSNNFPDSIVRQTCCCLLSIITAYNPPWSAGVGGDSFGKEIFRPTFESMDIRNFFGDKKTKSAAAPAELKTAPKLLRRKNVIDDEDSCDDPDIARILACDIIFSKNEKVKPSTSKLAFAPASNAKKATKAPAPTIAETPDKGTVEPTIGSHAKNASTSSTADEVKAKSSSNSGTDFDDILSWKAGESIPYLALIDTFEAISKISGRLEKESLFCKLFRAIIATTPSELDAIVHLASNSVGPAYEGLELGIGDSLLVKAVCEATGRKKDAVEEDYEKEGDLGTVALLSRNSQKTLSFAAKPKPLLAIRVLEMLRAITRTKGEKAQSRKVEIIKGIMVKCQGSEAKYIVRALQGKLRIGTAEQTVLVALAHAIALSPTPSVSSLEVKEVVSESVAQIGDSDVTEMTESASSSTGESRKIEHILQLVCHDNSLNNDI